MFDGSASGIAPTADLVIAGTVAEGQLGAGLAGAGDVNADGYADLVAGVPAADGAIGRILVFHGSAAGLDATPDADIPGNSAGGGFFGQAVAGVGDLDGDGIDDVAVGAFGVDGRTGRVSIFLGGMTGLRTPPAIRVDGPFGGNGDFGWTVAGAGDVDGSGAADLAVGSPGVDDGDGRVYVYRGSALTGITPEPLRALVGPSGGSFGRALARPER